MSIKSSLLEAKQRLSEISDEMEAIASVADQDKREISEDEISQIKDLTDEHDKLTVKIDRLETASKAQDKIAAAKLTPEIIAASENQTVGTQVRDAKASVKLKSAKSSVFSNSFDAYSMGQWLNAVLLGKDQSKKWCAEHGIGSFANAMEEGTDSLGGYAVPTPLAATIIELMQEFGVFRTYARNVTMTSATLDVPKLPEVPMTAGLPDSTLTVFYPGEGGAITASDLTFGNVALSAVKYAQQAVWSTELDEDAVISMVDLLTRDIARNFAHAEDLNSFIGDGTATYGGITGITAALQAGATHTLAATNTAVTDIALSDLSAMCGLLKEYPGMSPRWFMSRSVYYNAIEPLLDAAGGTSMRHLEEGGMRQMYGYPITFTQVLPGVGAAAGSNVIVLGDLDLGCYLGVRRQVSIRTLTELYAANDQLAIIATTRSDSVTHSVGDADDAGCIVQLATAAT